MKITFSTFPKTNKPKKLFKTELAKFGPSHSTPCIFNATLKHLSKRGYEGFDEIIMLTRRAPFNIMDGPLYPGSLTCLLKEGTLEFPSINEPFSLEGISKYSPQAYLAAHNLRNLGTPSKGFTSINVHTDSGKAQLRDNNLSAKLSKVHVSF